MKKIKYIPLFAYGILRFPPTIRADGGVNIVEAAKVVGCKLYAQGGKGISLAHRTDDKNDKVIGTYFEIPEDVLLIEYDYIEGFNPNDPNKENNMYNRELVTVILPDRETKKANMYMANPSWFWSDFIPLYEIKSGNANDKYLLLNKGVEKK